MPHSATLSGNSRNRATISGHAPITDLMTRPETPGDRSDQARGRSRRHRRAKGDKAAALVEFAIVMPLLFLLIFGVIEFGWAFRQNLDVRHGAREGTRLAAVNANPSNGESSQQRRIARETCARMDNNPSSSIQITIDVDGTLVSDPVGDTTLNDVGDEVTITVRKPLDQLTQFLGFALNGITLSSTVKTRLEQPATYQDLTIADGFTC